MGVRFIPRPKTPVKHLLSKAPSGYKNLSYTDALTLFQIFGALIASKPKGECLISNSADKYMVIRPGLGTNERSAKETVNLLDLDDSFVTQLIVPVRFANAPHCLTDRDLTIVFVADAKKIEQCSSVGFIPPTLEQPVGYVVPKPKKRFKPRLPHNLHLGKIPKLPK